MPILSDQHDDDSHDLLADEELCWLDKGMARRHSRHPVSFLQQLLVHQIERSEGLFRSNVTCYKPCFMVNSKLSLVLYTVQCTLDTICLI